MIKKLTDEEFLSHFYLYRQHGNQTSLAIIVEEHQGLIGYIADRAVTKAATFHEKGGIHSKVEWGDLMQAGNVGLMEALHCFDPGRGVKFDTFAFDRIRKRIYLFVRSCLLVGSARFQFKNTTSIEGLPREPVQRGLRAKEERLEIVSVVGKIVKLFSEREQRMLTMRFGLDGEEEKSMREIGAVMKLSHPQVSQKINRCLAEMKVIYERFQNTGKIMREIPRNPR